MANEAEIIASNLLSSAIEYKRLYDTTKKIEYREKEQRLRRIAENVKLLASSSSASTLDPETGMRFRREVLAVGGARPAAESFRVFRGREPKLDALLRHHGMTPAFVQTQT